MILSSSDGHEGNITVSKQNINELDKKIDMSIRKKLWKTLRTSIYFALIVHGINLITLT